MDDDWPTELGKRIRKARAKAGLSQQGLAHLIDRTPASVSNWERAERTPDFVEIRKIAEWTNADPRWLLFGASYQDPLTRIEKKVDKILALAFQQELEDGAEPTEQPKSGTG
jgi:transcriptional regulator with XRE-family HTH domain